MEDVNYTMIMCVYCIYFYGCIYMLSRIGKFAKYILSHGRQYILCACVCVSVGGGDLCLCVCVYVSVLTYFYLSLLLLLSLLYLFERVYYTMGNEGGESSTMTRQTNVEFTIIAVYRYINFAIADRQCSLLEEITKRVHFWWICGVILLMMESFLFSAK